MALDRRKMLKRIAGSGTIAAVSGCIGVEQQGTDGGGGEDGGQSNGGQSSGGTDTETREGAGTATAWYGLSDTELALREEAIAAFNEQSHHTVEGGNIAEMQDRTTSAIPAGQGPQTFQWAHDWVGDYYERGFVVDQSDELSVGLDQFTDAAASAVQTDDAVVGLPFSAETVTLIYNADIVDEAPETFDEMASAMADYHDSSNGQYGLAMPFDPYFVSGIVQAFGGRYFDSESDPVVGLDSEETIRGFEFLVDELVPYMPSDPGFEPQQATFVEGNAAFAVNGPWYLAALNDSDVDYGVTTFPSIDGNEFTPLTGIKMWYFSKATAAGDAAARAGREFVEWFVTNEDHLLTRAEEQGHIPVLSRLAGSDDLPGPVKSYSKAVDQGIPMPTDPRMSDVFAAMEEPVVQIFNGSQSPAQALRGAAEEARSNWE
ncbi:extracellular solute-binding protein [Halosimplex sp. J119]